MPNESSTNAEVHRNLHARRFVIKHGLSLQDTKLPLKEASAASPKIANLFFSEARWRSSLRRFRPVYIWHWSEEKRRPNDDDPESPQWQFPILVAQLLLQKTMKKIWLHRARFGHFFTKRWKAHVSKAQERHQKVWQCLQTGGGI